MGGFKVRIRALWSKVSVNYSSKAGNVTVTSIE